MNALLKRYEPTGSRGSKQKKTPLPFRAKAKVPIGRNEGIRTPDPYHPKVVHYQAVLRPGKRYYTRPDYEFHNEFLCARA